MEFDEQKPADQPTPNPALNSSPPAPNSADQTSPKMATYAEQHPEPPKPTGQNRRRWFMAAAILIILGAVAAGYWFFLKPKPAPTNTNSNTQTSQTTEQPASTTPIDSTTKTYNSTNFNLSFTYPADWTINDPGGNTMTAISPVTNLKDAAGQSVSGKIILTIAKKGTNLSAFDKGDATAVLDSQKITYSNPTQNQRANTYLSFLQYASTTASGALDSIDITGDFGYSKAQNIPKTDIANMDPLITVTFAKCSDNACSSSTALSIPSSEWSNSALSTPITNMLKSFAIN